MYRSRVSRRSLLATSGAALASLALPSLSRAASRPIITHGVQSGDVSTGSGVIWARADRPSRMEVEWSTTEGFSAIGGGATVDAPAETDFCAKAFMRDLPPGQTVFYRVRFRDIADANGVSERIVYRPREGIWWNYDRWFGLRWGDPGDFALMR